MKLIAEKVEEAKFILQEDKETNTKNLFLEGIFLQAEVVNGNRRKYPVDILENEVNRYIKEQIETKRAFGELGHPDNPTINLDRVSHLVTEIRKDGNNFIGKARVLNTPNGNIVKSLIEEGASLGVSSRGLGSLSEEALSEGGVVNVVNNDYRICTAADIVADPSAPDAFVRGIMENREWVYVNGKYLEQDIEQAKTAIKAAPSSKLEEQKIIEFIKFLTSLKK